MRAIVGLCVCLLSACVAPSEPAPDVPAEIPPEQRKKAVEVLTKEAARRPLLLKLEKEAVAKLAANPRLKSVREDLEFYRKELKPLKAIDTPEGFAQPLSFTRVGEVGKFPHRTVRVSAVFNKQTGTVMVDTVPTSNTPGGATEPERVLLVVSGIDTSKWADGLNVPAPEGVFYIGTIKHRGDTHLHLIRLELSKAESEAIMKAAKP